MQISLQRRPDSGSTQTVQSSAWLHTLGFALAVVTHCSLQEEEATHLGHVPTLRSCLTTYVF